MSSIKYKLKLRVVNIIIGFRVWSILVVNEFVFVFFLCIEGFIVKFMGLGIFIIVFVFML